MLTNVDYSQDNLKKIESKGYEWWLDYIEDRKVICYNKIKKQRWEE